MTYHLKSYEKECSGKIRTSSGVVAYLTAHSDNGPAFIAHVFQVAMAAFDVELLPLPCTTQKATLLSDSIEA